MENDQGDSQYKLYKAFLSVKDEVYLDSLDAPIKYLPDFGSLETSNIDKTDKNVDHPETLSLTTRTIDTCNQNNLPSSATIHYNPDAGTDGVVYGNIGVCDDIYTQPQSNGKHTQRIYYVVKTDNYTNHAAHTPTIGWFKAQLHGIGMYFGDTSILPCQNGNPGTHNTRVEAWSQWYPTSPVPEKNSSTGVGYNDTCGAPWQDGKYYFVDLYAYDSQWSSYSVYRYDLLYGNTYQWNLITPSVTKYVGFSQWINQNVSSVNGVFDSSAKGTWIGSTGPTSNPQQFPQHRVAWDIELFYINRTWY